VVNEVENRHRGGTQWVGDFIREAEQFRGMEFTGGKKREHAQARIGKELTRPEFDLPKI
jgi:hypothetical protein